MTVAKVALGGVGLLTLVTVEILLGDPLNLYPGQIAFSGFESFIGVLLLVSVLSVIGVYLYLSK